jgi:hypothetical protein
MSHISDLNFSVMAYSAYAAPSIMPLIHPSEEDLQMGAVDYLLENPFENLTESSTISSSVQNSTRAVMLNTTLAGKITDTIRSIVPQLVQHVASGITPEVVRVTSPHVGDHAYSGGLHEDGPQAVPDDAIVGYTPMIPSQACV